MKKQVYYKLSVFMRNKMNKIFDCSHILLNETYHQLFYLIIDHRIEIVCRHSDIVFYILIFFSFSLSLSLFSSNICSYRSWNALSFLLSPIAQWFNLSLAAINLINSHMIAYNIESSPAAIIEKDRYWIACCFFFLNEKLIT